MPLDDYNSAPALSTVGDLAAPAAEFAPERYERGVELGRGGMGQVLSVRDANLDRNVALKRLLRDDGGGARLAREARITARLEHPGIVPVYSAGRDADGAIYYTMRLVRGRSLREAIVGAEDLEGLLGLVRHVLDACRAIAYAHSVEVLHRDIKPSNIMIGEFGETLVVDWGVARTFSEPDGGVVGTAGFMSPEQAGGRASVASDVYSLGEVLRATTMGADNPELAAIVSRATAPDPEARYPDAMAMADELERWFSGRRVVAHSYSAGELLGRLVRAWRVPLLVTAVAAVVIAATGLLAWQETAAERDRTLVAEAGLRTALDQADSLLGSTLVAQAQQAQARRAQPEAEVLALAALERGPSPLARGVLAAFGPDRPTLTSSFPLPECRSLAVDGLSGRVACGMGARVTIFEADGRIAWEVSANLRAARPHLGWRGAGGPGARHGGDHHLPG